MNAPTSVDPQVPEPFTSGVALTQGLGFTLAPFSPPQQQLPGTDENQPPAVPINMSMTSVTAVAAQPIHIYPRAALSLLKLKCPLVRAYNDNAAASMGAKLLSGMNRTFANFDGGSSVARRICGGLDGFNEATFNMDALVGGLPGKPAYTCQQARDDGSTHCPASGCTLPTGTIAQSPVELLTWECNVKTLSHSAIAASVVTSEYGCELIRVRDKLYVYDKGIFNVVHDDELLRKIMPHLGQMQTVRRAMEIGNLLKILHAPQRESIKPESRFICFQNGTLNVATREMEPHKSRHLLLNRIEYHYDPTATCPDFLSFLGQTFEGDEDRNDKIKLLQEWFGYQLIADTTMQKMLILKGDGANGKSVVMDLAKHLVGSKNTTAAMLHRLRLPHVRAELEGMLLNQSADLPKHGIMADGDMKSIVSGDGIEVSPKHKPSFTIKPYARLMVATNHLPHSSDASEGYFRRLIILTFNNLVAPENRDPQLLEKLKGEMCGVVAWAIQGLYALLEQGRFTEPSSSVQVASQYREETAPIIMFSEECLEHSHDRSGFHSKDLFMAFRAWCRDRGFDAGDVVSMGRQLQALGYDSRKSGTTMWLVKLKAGVEEYFNARQMLDEPADNGTAAISALPIASA